MKYILCFCLLFFVALILPRGMNAQWQQVYQVSALNYGVGWFGCMLNKNNIIFIAVGKNLYITKDTAKTWDIKPVPGNGLPIDIDFFNDSIGVICELGEVYFTKDQGNSWSRLNIDGFQSLCFVGAAQKIMVDAHFSTDEGNTWVQTIPPEIVQCVRFSSTNGLLYATGFNGGNLYISRDSGLSWNKTPGIFDGDSWSFAIDSCENNNKIFVVNEDCVQNKNGLGEVFVTTDNGSSWTSHFAKPVCHVSGSIAIGRRAVFCPTQSDGIYRTLDQGKTWLPIGGPSSPFDTRMIAAINDKIVVAADAMGIVWITYNSGGVPIPPPQAMPFVQSPNFKPITSCNQTIDSILLTPRPDCGSTTIITKISLNGKDSALFSILPTETPFVLSSDTGFKRIISFAPNGNINNDSAYIHIHGFYLSSSDSIAFDTTILMIGKSIAVPPQLSASPNALTYDTLSTCQPPQDTVVTLTNKGCDTLEIISGPGALGAEFSLVTPLTFPLKLAPDSSITITFGFKPSGTGRFVTTAKFTALQQSLTQDISLDIEGYGEKDVGVLAFSPKSFNFKSISICAHDSASGFVANIGCDSLQLDPAKIFGNPDFKVVGGGLKVVGLKPGDTIHYEVYLNPAQKGLRQGFLVLNSNDGIRSRRDSIPFSTTVTDGTRILSASTNAVDFGKQSLCDPQKDTVVTIRNTGCDTLQVSGVAGLGTGFGTNTTFPITILPGDSAKVDIFTLLDTAGGKLSNSASLTFTSNSDNTIPPITLSHSFIAGVSHNLGLFLDGTPQSGGDLSTVTYTIKETPGKSFSGAGVNTLNFDLNYNTDVLNFTPAKSSANLSSANGKNFIITGSPITADANGILASVGFTVYLTKDSTTNIILTNRNDTTLSPCGITTLSMSGSATFDYQYLCGERSISSYLRDNSLIHINSIHPNPAQDEVIINLHSANSQEVNLEVFDALGVRMYSSQRSLASGATEIHLDTHSYGAGVYLVRVGGVSERVVISR